MDEVLPITATRPVILAPSLLLKRLSNVLRVMALQVASPYLGTVLGTVLPVQY